MSDVSDSGALGSMPTVRIDTNLVAPRHFVRDGDVLFRSRGARNAAWALEGALSEPAVALMPLYVLRPAAEVLDSGYLAWFLNQSAAERHFAQGAAGTKIRMIHVGVLESLELRLPPLETQRLISHLASTAAEERKLAGRLVDRTYQLHNLKLAALLDDYDASSSIERHENG